MVRLSGRWAAYSWLTQVGQFPYRLNRATDRNIRTTILDGRKAETRRAIGPRYPLVKDFERADRRPEPHRGLLQQVEEAVVARLGGTHAVEGAVVAVKTGVYPLPENAEARIGAVAFGEGPV